MQQGTALMTPETVLPLLNDPRLEALTDSALKRLFAVQFRLGIADPPDKVRHSQLPSVPCSNPILDESSAASLRDADSNE